MAMAVASARYESEDAYRIDYREIFFRDPSLSRFLTFFFFFNFFTAQTFRDSFDQRVQTEREIARPFDHLRFHFCFVLYAD